MAKRIARMWTLTGSLGATDRLRYSRRRVACSFARLASAAVLAAVAANVTANPVYGDGDASGGAPTITVTSPNGGENWQAESTQNITWDSTSPSGEVLVSLLKNGAWWDFIGSAPTASGPLTEDERLRFDNQ